MRVCGRKCVRVSVSACGWVCVCRYVCACVCMCVSLSVRVCCVCHSCSTSRSTWNGWFTQRDGPFLEWLAKTYVINKTEMTLQILYISETSAQPSFCFFFFNDRWRRHRSDHAPRSPSSPSEAHPNATATVLQFQPYFISKSFSSTSIK